MVYYKSYRVGKDTGFIMDLFALPGLIGQPDLISGSVALVALGLVEMVVEKEEKVERIPSVAVACQFVVFAEFVESVVLVLVLVEVWECSVA